MPKDIADLDVDVERIQANLEQLVDENRNNEDKWRVVKQELFELCSVVDDLVHHLQSRTSD